MEHPNIDFDKIQNLEQCYAIKHSSDSSVIQKLRASLKEQQIINVMIEIVKNGGVISDSDKIEMDRVLNEQDEFLNAVMSASDTTEEEKQFAKNIEEFKQSNKLELNTPLNVVENHESQLDVNVTQNHESQLDVNVIR